MRTPTLPRILAGTLALCALVLMTGCRTDPHDPDPLENVNRFFYHLNDDIDVVVLKPASDVYVKVVPKPIRHGISNGFDNLTYGNVIVNDFLQGRWDQGWSDTGRMATNTTFGIAGIFDPATKWGMPAHDNDFGLTLAKWGVKKPGPYLVLPLFGPSTLRDAPGLAVSTFTNPVYWIAPPWYVTVPLSVVGALDARSRIESLARFRNQAAIDPYVFTREAYLQYRQALIDGNGAAPPPPDQSLYEDTAELESGHRPATAPTTRPATTP